jgi:hypothetical protein
MLTSAYICPPTFPHIRLQTLMSSSIGYIPLRPLRPLRQGATLVSFLNILTTTTY